MKFRMEKFVAEKWFIMINPKNSSVKNVTIQNVNSCWIIKNLEDNE
jgi:hypothetical protein